MVSGGKNATAEQRRAIYNAAATFPLFHFVSAQQGKYFNTEEKE
jgi:hypothetical protein